MNRDPDQSVPIFVHSYMKTIFSVRVFDGIIRQSNHKNGGGGGGDYQLKDIVDENREFILKFKRRHVSGRVSRPLT